MRIYEYDTATVLSFEKSLYGFVKIWSKSRTTCRMGLFSKVNLEGEGNIEEFQIAKWAAIISEFDRPFNYHRYDEGVKTRFWERWEEVFALSGAGDSKFTVYRHINSKEYFMVKIHSRDLKIADDTAMFVTSWHEEPGRYQETIVIGQRDDLLDVSFNMGTMRFPNYKSISYILEEQLEHDLLSK